MTGYALSRTYRVLYSTSAIYTRNVIIRLGIQSPLSAIGKSTVHANMPTGDARGMVQEFTPVSVPKSN